MQNVVKVVGPYVADLDPILASFPDYEMSGHY